MTAGSENGLRTDSVGDEALWFLGTFARVRLDGHQTSGRLGVFEVTFPRGAAPPLHSHPQDETLYVIEGEVTAWIVEPELAADADGDHPVWLSECARRCGPGATVFAAAGIAHSFRVESDSARVLILSTPAGIEAYVRALSEPARWPWLPPPSDGPRVSAERLQAADREHGVVVYAPPPVVRSV